VETETQNSPHNYNHDLEISADLWVETCQRIVNQFDSNNVSPTQSRDDEALPKALTDVDRSKNTSYSDAAYMLDGASINFAMSTVYPKNDESDVPFYAAEQVEQRYPRIDLHDYCIQETDNASTKMVDPCANSFAVTNVVHDNIDNVVCHKLPETQICTESRTSCNDNVRTCGDSVPLEDTDLGVSDLRDRVNSVTALYNIVESELDEQKKKLIRYYVDSMFRVLQYRNSKCKPKKRSTMKRPRQRPSVTAKHLNRRGRSVRMNGAVRKKALGVPRLRRTTTPNSHANVASTSIPANVTLPLTKNSAASHPFQFF
jgi:hypothetical protein